MKLCLQWQLDPGTWDTTWHRAFPHRNTSWAFWSQEVQDRQAQVTEEGFSADSPFQMILAQGREACWEENSYVLPFLSAPIHYIFNRYLLLLQKAILVTILTLNSLSSDLLQHRAPGYITEHLLECNCYSRYLFFPFSMLLLLLLLTHDTHPHYSPLYVFKAQLTHKCTLAKSLFNGRFLAWTIFKYLHPAADISVWSPQPDLQVSYASIAFICCKSLVFLPRRHAHRPLPEWSWAVWQEFSPSIRHLLSAYSVPGPGVDSGGLQGVSDSGSACFSQSQKWCSVSIRCIIAFQHKRCLWEVTRGPADGPWWHHCSLCILVICHLPHDYCDHWLSSCK